jgi:hypothetical protein
MSVNKMKQSKMTFTVHIASTIRSVVDDLPKTIVVVKDQPLTVKQLAAEIGIPHILIVAAVVNGVKTAINETLTHTAEIHFIGTMAGG